MERGWLESGTSYVVAFFYFDCSFFILFAKIDGMSEVFAKSHFVLILIMRLSHSV